MLPAFCRHSVSLCPILSQQQHLPSKRPISNFASNCFCSACRGASSWFIETWLVSCCAVFCKNWLYCFVRCKNVVFPSKKHLLIWCSWGLVQCWWVVFQTRRSGWNVLLCPRGLSWVWLLDLSERSRKFSPLDRTLPDPICFFRRLSDHLCWTAFWICPIHRLLLSPRIWLVTKAILLPLPATSSGYIEVSVLLKIDCLILWGGWRASVQNCWIALFPLNVRSCVCRFVFVFCSLIGGPAMRSMILWYCSVTLDICKYSAYLVLLVNTTSSSVSMSACCGTGGLQREVGVSPTTILGEYPAVVNGATVWNPKAPL